MSDGGTIKVAPDHTLDTHYSPSPSADDCFESIWGFQQLSRAPEKKEKEYLDRYCMLQDVCHKIRKSDQYVIPQWCVQGSLTTFQAC